MMGFSQILQASKNPLPLLYTRFLFVSDALSVPVSGSHQSMTRKKGDSPRFLVVSNILIHFGASFKLFACALAACNDARAMVWTATGEGRCSHAPRCTLVLLCRQKDTKCWK